MKRICKSKKVFYYFCLSFLFFNFFFCFLEEETYHDEQRLEDNAEYIALKKEKRRLQCFLHQFQSEFISKNGRKVQYVQDRQPVQKEYDEYKVKLYFLFYYYF